MRGHVFVFVRIIFVLSYFIQSKTITRYKMAIIIDLNIKRMYTQHQDAFFQVIFFVFISLQ